MIRHDRVPLGALSEHDVAQAAGYAWNTWRTTKKDERKKFKARVPSLTTEHDRLDAYDPEQVRAYLTADIQMPTLVTRDQDLDDDDKHPEDLLTDYEAAAARGIDVKSLQRGVRSGQFTGHVEIAGIRWWPRHALTPGKAGRPAGSTDSAPRALRWHPIHETAENRINEIIQQIRDGAEPTPDALAERYNVHKDTARRYLARARKQLAKA